MRFQATFEDYSISRILAGVLNGEGVADASPTNALEANAKLFLDHFGDKKIQAIKGIRQHANLSLRDAKDLYEAVADEFDPLKHLGERKRYALRRSLRLVKQIQDDLEDEAFDSVVRQRTNQLLQQVDKLTRE